MLAESSRPVLTSGECEIDVARRELRIRGAAVSIGGRAFDIIEALALAAGELVTKDELMDRVWPGAAVMEGTLYVHVVAIRRALGPLRALLKTESRRGYRLLGEWVIRRREADKAFAVAHSAPGTALPRRSNLPAMVTRLVGRSADLRQLQDIVSAYRIVCLTGIGGIGKTTLALDLARTLLDNFDDGAWLIELASLADPDLVVTTVASVLGLQSGSATPSIEAVAHAIADRKLLLVIDNCEHLIGAVAAFSVVVARLCPHVTIIATSREILSIEGEYAYRVPGLAVPARDENDAESILAHSAPELFIARAKELGSDFSTDPRSLLTIASICRDLDGIPLALELAAARAAALGLEHVEVALRDSLATLTSRRRDALPRHQTLRLTLDWSYNLLSESERRLLQRLSVFSGSFSLSAATAVAGREPACEASIGDGISSLLAKSLVSSDTAGDLGYFRLLETTRVYSLAKLAESGEVLEFSQRHAEYYRMVLDRVEGEQEKRAVPLADLDNVRNALEWCFGPEGNVAVGVRLAAAATPVLLAMSLFQETRRWSEQALGALDSGTSGGKSEMQLQASLGVSLMQMLGQSDAARAAITRGLAIAEVCGDTLNRVALLGMLSMFHVRDGDFVSSLRDAKQSRAVPGAPDHPAALALANSILGRALQFVGEHDASRIELEASFQYWSRADHRSEVYLGLDHHILVGIGLARNRWFEGFPTQAKKRLHQTVADAELKNHPASLGLALSWAPGLFIWLGDLDSAAAHADWLSNHARTHSLGPYIAVALGYRGMLAVCRGDAPEGIQCLRVCLEQLQSMRYAMLSTDFSLSLVRGLVAVGSLEEALAFANQTIRRIEVNGDLLHMPEALRVKAGVLLASAGPLSDDIETCLSGSIGWSRRQGARSWELRAAVDLASLWASRRQIDRAQALLVPVIKKFTEGFETPNLIAATKLLTTLE